MPPPHVGIDPERKGISMALTSSTLHGAGRLKRLVAAGVAAFAAAVLAVGVCAGTAQAASDTIVIDVTEESAQQVDKVITGKIDILDGNLHRSQKMELKNSTEHYLITTIRTRMTSPSKDAEWRIFFGASNVGYVDSNGNNWVYLCTKKYIAPGDSVEIEGWEKSYKQNQTFEAKIMYRTDFDKPVNVNIQTKKPTVKAVKLSATKASVKVTVPQAVNSTGKTRVDVYAGSKKVKSFETLKQPSDVTRSGETYAFTYSAKGAGTAKYSAKLTTVGKESDTIKSAAVKPGANVLKVKAKSVSGIGVRLTKLSYSGSKLVIEGKTVNKTGAAAPKMMNIIVYSKTNGCMIASVIKQVTFPKGTKSFKYTVKASKVIDLTDSNDLKLTY